MPVSSHRLEIKEMLSDRQAVKTALDYLESLYSHPLEGLDLEEIQRSDDQKHWLVTLGYWEPKPRSPLDQELDKAGGRLVLRVPSAEVIRTYKLVTVNAETGEAVSVKMREE
jgi:hypothetical protein